MGNFDNVGKGFSTVEAAGVLNMTLFGKISGPRALLTTSYYDQMIVLDRPNIPRMLTGYEKEFGSYNNSIKIANVQYRILCRIEKYPTNPGYFYCLVLEDTMTGIITAMEFKHYEVLSEGHGYLKCKTRVDTMYPGHVIPKGTVMAKTTTIDDHGNFRYGVDAKFAFISRKEVIEDGYAISESFSKRVTYQQLKEVEITLGFNDILLNQYGDGNFYKSFPDIFETVKDGILCVKRSVDYEQAPCSLTEKALRSINTNDDVFAGNGQILDIEIFVNNNAELLKDNTHMEQILSYYGVIRDYKRNIVEALHPYITTNTYRFTAEAGQIYHKYKSYVDACDDLTNNATFSNGPEPFEFIMIKFTIGRTDRLKVGGKMSNRYGNKGVICKILPDIEMPVDQWGVRAEVLSNPLGVVGRSNPGQLYEHELNFIASRVSAMVANETRLVERYKLVRKFYNMTDALTGSEFMNFYESLCTNERSKLLNDVAVNGLYVRQHPFESISMDGMRKLYQEFDIKPGKVNVSVPYDGKLYTYLSNSPVIIADMYMLILKHTTESKSSTTSISDTNTMGLPFKSAGKNRAGSHRDTPIRFGEMEMGIIYNRMSSNIVNRFIAASVNAKHRDAVARMLFTTDPRKLHDVDVRDEDICDNIGAMALESIMCQIGFSMYSATRYTPCKVFTKI